MVVCVFLAHDGLLSPACAHARGRSGVGVLVRVESLAHQVRGVRTVMSGCWGSGGAVGLWVDCGNGGGEMGTG